MAGSARHSLAMMLHAHPPSGPCTPTTSGSATTVVTDHLFSQVTMTTTPTMVTTKSIIIYETTTLVHAPPPTLLPILLTSLPTLFTTNLTTDTSLFHYTQLNRNTHLLYFVHSVPVGNSASGKIVAEYREFALRVTVAGSLEEPMLEGSSSNNDNGYTSDTPDVPARTVVPQPDPDDGSTPSSTTLTITSIPLTDPSLPSRYTTVLGYKHFEAVQTATSSSIPLKLASISGDITLTTAPHGCTRLTSTFTQQCSDAPSKKGRKKRGTSPAASPLAQVSSLFDDADPDTSDGRESSIHHEPSQVASSRDSPHISSGRIISMNATSLTPTKPSLPTSFQSRHLLAYLGTLPPNLHTRFKRYAAVDKAMLTTFVDAMPHAPPLQDCEEALIAKTLLFDDHDTLSKTHSTYNPTLHSPLSNLTENLLKQPTWHRIPATLNSPVSYFQKFTHNAAAWGKAITIVNTGHATVAAWLYEYMQHDRIDSYITRNGPRLRKSIPVPGARSKVVLTMRRFPTGFDDRVFPTWLCWKVTEEDGVTPGDIVIALTPAAEHPSSVITSAVDAIIKNDANASVAIRGTTRGFWRLTYVALNVCRITLVQSVNFGGSIPEWMLNTRVRDALKPAAELEKMYRRNERIVDEEVRNAWKLPPPIAALAPDQLTILKSAMKFEKGSIGGKRNGKQWSSIFRAARRHLHSSNDWLPIESKSPFVHMSYRHNHHATHSRGNAHVVLGRAVAPIDVSALRAAAFINDHCSRRRMRQSVQEGHPARIIVEAKSPYDRVLAGVRVAPFPLSKREWVLREITAVDAAGDFLIASDTVDDVVDYGGAMRKIRVIHSSLFRFTPTGPDSCTCTLIQYNDLGGRIPSYVLNNNVHTSMRVMVDMRETLARDKVIDRGLWKDTIKVIEESEEDYTDDENETHESCVAKLATLRNCSFTALESPDPFVTMGLANHEGSELCSSGTLKAFTVLDCSVAEAAAWDLNIQDRAHTKNHAKVNGQLRTFDVVNSHAGIYNVVYDYRIPGFKPREYLLRRIWKQTETQFSITYSTYASDDYPKNPNWVRATSNSLCRFDKLPPCRGFPQTRVTYMVQIDFRATVPHWAQVKLGTRSLMYVSKMRLNFDNSMEMDSAERRKMAGVIRWECESMDYTDEERDKIQEGITYFEVFEQNISKRKIQYDSPSVAMEIAFEQKKKSGQNKLPPPSSTTSRPTAVRSRAARKRRFARLHTLAWGRATVFVRASKEQCLAYIWNSDARSRWSGSDLERRIVENKNGHNMVIYHCKKGHNAQGFRLKPRDGLSNNLFASLPDGSLLFVGLPTIHESWPEQPNRVRAKMNLAIKIKEISPGLCKMVNVVQFDMGGTIPAVLMNFYIKASLGLSMRTQHYFQERRELGEYDSEDGKVLALRLMYPGGKRKENSKRWEMTAGIVEANVGLREMCARHEWFSGFLKEVVKGQLHRNKPVSGKVECLSEQEGIRMGANLAQALRQRKTAEAGLYQWKMQNPAVVELFDKYDWTESLMLVVAQEVLKTAPWGVVWRVCVGAGMSMLDLGSDLNIIRLYMADENQRGYAYCLVIMLVFNLALQSLIVLAQNSKKPWELLRDLVFVLFGLKPGVDAYRVTTGKEMEAHNVLDPKMELIGAKCVEMFAESIPGCVLQLYAYVKLMEKGESESQALVSIAISALTTGFTSATVSYDYDTDPKERKKNPAFFGFVPDKASTRTLLFFCLTLNSTLLLLLRSVSAVMLMCVDFKYYAWYTAGDVALYLLQKVLRKDFHYWVPVGGKSGVFVSILFRVVNKFITDYTGVVQFRSPNELGGIYWLVNVGLGLLGTFVAVGIYYDDKRSRGDTEVMMVERVAWLRVGAGVGGWLVLFGVFLWLMKKQYRRTFIDFGTGAAEAKNNFLRGESDEAKMQIFNFNTSQWTSIRGDVKDYVKMKWWRWEDEKPDWFTDNFKYSVPGDMIPAEVKVDLDRKRAGGRRRNSLGLLGLALGVRDPEQEKKKTVAAKKERKRHWDGIKGKIGADIWAETIMKAGSQGKKPVFKRGSSVAAAEDEGGVWGQLSGVGARKKLESAKSFDEFEKEAEKKRSKSKLARAGTVT